MKRSVQEIVELLVFGLIALLIGTGLLWLVGWIFDLAGVLFKFFAALIWSLLRFIVPVAVGAAIVYALVRLFQQQRDKRATEKNRSAAETNTAGSTLPPGTAPTTKPAAPGETAPSATVPPPTSPTVVDPEEVQPEEGESHPTASEVWVPPQPSPPTKPAHSGQETSPFDPESSTEETPGQETGPLGTEPTIEETIGQETGPLDHEPTVEDTTGQSSVPPADDEPLLRETSLEERLDEADGTEESHNIDDGDEGDDDERRS